MNSHDHVNERAANMAPDEEATVPLPCHVLERDTIARNYHILDALFQQSPACSALLQGPDHRFVLANALFRQTVGEQHLLGKPFSEALPYLAEQGFGKILDLVYTTGTSYHGREVPVRLKRSDDGSTDECYFTFIYQPMRNSSGQVDSIFVHGVDITTQVQTCKQVEQSQLKLQQEQAAIMEAERLFWSQEYTRMHERNLALQELNQQKDTFLSIVNHELKTPLTTASTSLQIAQRMLETIHEKLPSEDADISQRIREVKKLLTTAKQQMEFQTRLIHDLIDFSSIQANKLRIQKKTCDLVTIVREVVEEQQRSTSTHTLQLDLARNASIILPVDRDRIKQVLNNYLMNAIKYSFARGTIKVCLSRQQDMVCVQVQDEGPGLLPEDVQQVWDRSYQGRNSKGHETGLGLGLYICRMIIQQHQGQVGVENTPNGGATFWFTLPLT